MLVRDGVGGGEFEIEADNVVNATGVWADQLRPDELHAEEEVPHIRPSRGTHSRSRATPAAGARGDRARRGGRTIFVLPWLGRTLIGTTDNDYEGSLEHVPPDADDVDYLLEACNEFFGISLDRPT